MTILAAMQEAIARLIGRRPSAVFAAQEEICVEISSLSNEAATDIMKGHDWRALSVVYTITSNGVDGEYPFPDDYDRMVVASEQQNPDNYIWGYWFCPTIDDWIRMRNFHFNIFPGAWIILDGKFQYFPIPAAGQMAMFPYMSGNYALAANGTTTKPAFTRDDDSVRLLGETLGRQTAAERLMTLALIWRWKAMKLMDYQEDMRNYEIALSQEQGRDVGSRVIRKGTPYRNNLRSPFGPLY
jgi:hypothetical protein